MARGSIALTDGIFGGDVDTFEEVDNGAIGVWLMSSTTSVILASFRSVLALAAHPGDVRCSSVHETTLPSLTNVSGLDVDSGAHFDACIPLEG